MKKLVHFIVFCILLTQFYSCNKTEKSDSLVGTWSSLGNAWVLEIAQDSTYVEYDVTDISCQIARKSTIKEFNNRMSLKNDTLRLLRGAIEYRFVRVSDIPNNCNTMIDQKKAKDPVFNFEVFASTIRDNYAFFDLNDVEWDSLYQAQKVKIIESPSDLMLYKVMEETLNVINDNHGSFEASAEIYELLESDESSVSNETEEDIPEIGDFQIASEVASHHMEEEYTEDSFIVEWGRLNENTGYIQVKAMFLLTDMGMSKDLIDKLGWEEAWQQTYDKIGEGNYIEQERFGMEKTMGKVMEDLREMDQIVIDIRFNGGGQDLVSLELLRWFNDMPRVIAHESLVYQNGESPVWEIVLQKSNRAFKKPVFLLTSQQTGSAAEVCAMASMSMPNVYRIGMPTMGALSTALEKRLPNGWDFAISNEYYRTLDGEIYENEGIPVDREIIYPEDRQLFFKSVLKDLEGDKNAILEAIDELK